MSNLIIPDASKKKTLKIFVGIDAIDTPWKCKLFQNNYTPDHTTVIGDLTEATFGGYAAASLSSPAVAGALDGTGRAVCTWSDVTFTNTSGSNTIYGYYVTDTSGNLLWVERFDNPIVVGTVGAFITITPKLTDKSQFSNT